VDEASVTDAPIRAVTGGVTAACCGVQVIVSFFALDDSPTSLDQPKHEQHSCKKKQRELD